MQEADADQPGIVTRIREAAESKGLSQREVAVLSGISPGRINEYWNGKRAPKTVYLFAIADALDISAEWLATGRVRRPERHGVASSSDDLVVVQEIDLANGLGGTYSDGPVEVQTHHFPRAWLESITTTPPQQLTIARGRGDSMQPTLQDGDMVLIDRSQRTIREQDAIWALTIGDIAMIKRIRARDERVLILSDNDRIPPDEAHHEEINVVGRVIFIGRKL